MLRLPAIPRTLALCAVLVAFGCGGGDNNENGKANNTTPNNTTANNTTPNNTTPSCDDVPNPCTTPGSTCEGDLSVVCAQDANGCLVETTTDCAASGDVCQGGACQDPGECTDDPACDGLTDGARFCTGDTLTTCTAGADGCLDASTNDCAAMGQTCDADTQMCVGECTDDPACDGRVDGDAFCQADGGATVSCALNAGGCLVATTTPCGADQVCDATGGTPMCVADSCAAAIQTLSCADAGMTINGDTANGTSVVDGNTCPFGDPGAFGGNEAIYVFADAGNNEVTISFTYDDTTIDEFDAFALDGTGPCTDPNLTCAGYEWAFSSPGELTFAAAAGARTYLVFEPYDQPGATTPYGLTITCTPVVCGDGVISDSEECDDGNATDGDGCSAACTEEPNWLCSGEPSVCIQEVCGDGDITSSEECDDGNAADGDGCSAACLEEPLWICTGEPSVCVAEVCGDGDITVSEQCDDGNAADGDGCSAACAIEANYICSGEPSACVPDVCGDAILSPNETCDDGGTADGDGCSATCEREWGYSCNNAGVCTPAQSLGTFAAGDMIADTVGPKIIARESVYYTITFTTPVILSGSASRGTTGDIDVYITNADEDTVVAAAVSGDETWSGVPLPAGTYEIELTAFGSTDVDTYTLTLATTALGGADLGTFDVNGTPPVTNGGPLAAGASAWYQFTLLDDVVISGTLTSTSGDMDLYLLGPTGKYVIASAANGDEDFTLGLLAGTYYLQLNAWDGDVDAAAFTLTWSIAALGATDLGSVAAGGTIADQTGALTEGAAAYYKVTFTTDVTLDGTLGGNTTGETGVVVYSTEEFGLSAYNLGDETFSGTLTAGTYLISVLSAVGYGDVDAFTLTLDPN